MVNSSSNSLLWSCIKRKRDSTDTHYSTFTAPQRERWKSIFSSGNVSTPEDVHMTLKETPRVLLFCPWNTCQELCFPTGSWTHAREILFRWLHPNSLERGEEKKNKRKKKDIPLGKTTGTKKTKNQSVSLRWRRKFSSFLFKIHFS